jgi:hypothetical protein
VKTRSLVPAAIVVLAAAFAVAMLNRGHDWGDDFAAYIMQARGVVEGSPSDVVKHTTFTMRHSSRPTGPAVAPWGYPILLAPVYAACGGLNPLCLKLINFPFFALFVATFYAVAARRLPPLDAALVTAVFAFSPDLLSFHNDLLTDIPFLGLATWTLWLIDDRLRSPGTQRESPIWAVLLGIALFASFAVRTLGFVLVLALAITYAAIYRRSGAVMHASSRVRLLVPFVVFAALTAALTLALPADTSGPAAQEALSIASAVQNIKDYAAMPADFFWSVPYPFGIVFYGTLLAFVVNGARCGWATDLHLFAYVALMLSVTVVSPWQQGLRYLFPVLPWLVYIAYRGMIASAFALGDAHRRVGIWLTRAVWAVVLVCFVRASVVYAATNLSLHRAAPSGPFLPESTQLFAWVDANTHANDVVVFYKPRVMRLMTGRDALLIDKCGELRPNEYVVLNKALGTKGQIPPAETAACPPLQQSARLFENAAFVVYRVQ